MVHYPVYLEVTADKACMAHVLDLPGCFCRAPEPAAALSGLSQAVREYHAWLRTHGEPAPPAEDNVQLEVVEEIASCGPFDPGDAAALFSPERAAITPGEMETYFRLMHHSRADLLAMLSAYAPAPGQPLADEPLDWQPGTDSFTIRRILRHIGNAEEWYVSRLVPPKSLPPEWEGDEKLPLFEFLEMERRTAVERLRRLTEGQRSRVHHPRRWTRYPQEPWTARKALRRFLEHEREHTAQIREILARWERR